VHSKSNFLRAFPAHMMDDRNQLTACTQPPGHHRQEHHLRQPADVHSLLKRFYTPGNPAACVVTFHSSIRELSMLLSSRAVVEWG